MSHHHKIKNVASYGEPVHQQTEAVAEIDATILAGILGKEIRASLDTANDPEVVPKPLEVEAVVESASAALRHAWDLGPASSLGSAVALNVSPSVVNHLEGAAGGVSGGTDAGFASVSLTNSSLMCSVQQSNELVEDGKGYQASIDAAIAGSLAAEVDSICFTSVLGAASATASAATSLLGVTREEVLAVLSDLTGVAGDDYRIYTSRAGACVLRGLFNSGDRVAGLPVEVVSGNVFGSATGEPVLVVSSLKHVLALGRNPLAIRTSHESASLANAASDSSLRLGRLRISHGIAPQGSRQLAASLTLS